MFYVCLCSVCQHPHTLVNDTPPPPCPSPPLVLPQGGWGTVTCSTQKFSLQLTVLLWQNHHPRVLPNAFQWKVVSMCKSSRSSGAGPRKFTLSWSRSRSPNIGNPLSISCAEFFRLCCNFCACKCACTVVVRFPRGGWATVAWQPSPRGWWGTCSLGWGRTRGGGVPVVNSNSRPKSVQDYKRRRPSLIVQLAPLARCAVQPLFPFVICVANKR